MNHLINVKNKRYPFTSIENSFIHESARIIGEDWENISKALPGRIAKQVQNRYNNYLMDELIKREWSSEEDQTIIRLNNMLGPKKKKQMMTF